MADVGLALSVGRWNWDSWKSNSWRIAITELHDSNSNLEPTVSRYYLLAVRTKHYLPKYKKLFDESESQQEKVTGPRKVAGDLTDVTLHFDMSQWRRLTSIP